MSPTRPTLSGARRDRAPELSVIVPCADEADSLRQLLHELAAVFPADGPVQAEFVFVDDASVDGSARLLEELAAWESRLVPVLRSERGGQTRALWDGLARSRGRWIAHLDGDLQNDPADLPAMLERAAGSFDAVLGYRAQRQDGWSRRAASWLAGAIRRAVLGDRIRDVGCATRVVRREALESLPPVPHLHRYLPALLECAGWRTLQVPVRHRPRRAGTSKYGNLGRALAGVWDLPRMARLARRLRRERTA